MESGLVILLLVIFVFVTIVFIAVAIFFPELVGIQGKTARSIEKSHADDSVKKEN